jgi:hypothetical protein
MQTSRMAFMPKFVNSLARNNGITRALDHLASLESRDPIWLTIWRSLVLPGAGAVWLTACG